MDLVDSPPVDQIEAPPDEHLKRNRGTPTGSGSGGSDQPSPKRQFGDQKDAMDQDFSVVNPSIPEMIVPVDPP